MNSKILYLLSFFLFTLSDLTFGNAHQYPISIKAIEFQGLRHIQAEQVSPYLPLKIGQNFAQENIHFIVKSLYASGFFETIDLLAEADTIIVKVKERPVIKQITINQQSQLPDNMLKQLLEKSNIRVGEFFSENAFQAFKKELQSFYNMQGKYQHLIHTECTFNKHQDQVSLKINLPAQKVTLRFADIYIVGNVAFSKKALLACLPVTNSLWKGLLSNKALVCHPSIQQMALEELKQFYQNRGYFDIAVKTQHTSLTPDQTAAYWIIEVKEGPLYRMGEYKVIGSHTLSPEELKETLHFTAQQVYSKEIITKAEKALKDKLGFFSKVQIIPSINQKNCTIDLTINIDSAKAMYVRKLHITGNQFIQDQAIRQLCQQQENALFSSEAVKASENRINRAGFSKSPVFMLPINISDDQVDLVLQIDEKDEPSERKVIPGEFSFGKGAFDVNFLATMGNVLGSGKKIDARISKTTHDYFLSFLYHNPYTTPDGIQQTTKVVFKSSNPWLLLSERMQSFIEKVKFRPQHAPQTVKQITPVEPATSESTKETAVRNIFYDIFSFFDLYNLLKMDKLFTDFRIVESAKFESVELPEYNMNEIIANFDYGIPINQAHHLWHLSFEPKIFQLHLPQSLAAQSQELKAFIDKYGKNLFHMRFTTSFNSSQLEASSSPFSSPFPEQGFTNQLKMTLTSLWTQEWQWWPYIKLDIGGAVFKRFQLNVKQAMNVGMRWKIGYGFSLNDNEESLPFFENYHSGQLKGFFSDSLGHTNNLNQQLGGNFLLNGSIMLFAPEPLRGDSFKVSAFCDIGALEKVTNLQQLSREFAPRLSIGLALDLAIPVPIINVLPITVYVAQPMWYKDKDKTQPFSILFGNTFL